MKFVPRYNDVGESISTYYNCPNNFWSVGDFSYNTAAPGEWKCTYHVMARSCEIAHKAIDRRWNSDNPIFPNRDGWPDAKNFTTQTGWATGSTPKLGAIVVWRDSGAGHVGIVEKVYDNGNIDISQANLTIDGVKTKFWIHRDCLPTDSLYVNKGLTFDKYIYNPYASQDCSLGTRNKNINQLKSDDPHVRIREDHNTTSNILDFVSTSGYYEVLDTYQGSDYKWYKLDDHAWVAGVGGIEYLPMDISYKKYPISLYDDGINVGVAFGKKATKENTVEFDTNLSVKATSIDDTSETVTVDAYDLVKAGKREVWTFTLEDGTEITKEVSAWTVR